MNERLDEGMLPKLIERFYVRVRVDELLGPLFNDAVNDWPHHLERLCDFWSSVMLTSGRYKGNPMAMHLKHAKQIEPAMFDRWLALWREITAEMLPSPVAAAMLGKAARIAESLQLALKLDEPGGRDAMLQKREAPYRSTPVFNEESLPEALRRAHSTKAGVWGVIRVLSGRLRYIIEETGAETVLDAATPGCIRPQELHRVTPIGSVRMRVDFYDHEPSMG